MCVRLAWPILLVSVSFAGAATPKQRDFSSCRRHSFGTVFAQLRRYPMSDPSSPGSTQPVNQMEALSFALEQRAIQLAACESEVDKMRDQVRALEEDLARALKLGAL